MDGSLVEIPFIGGVKECPQGRRESLAQSTLAGVLGGGQQELLQSALQAGENESVSWGDTSKWIVSHA